MAGGGNPYPFQSKEWHEHNAAEVASRPTAILKRKPFTGADFDSYRPKEKEENGATD